MWIISSHVIAAVIKTDLLLENLNALSVVLVIYCCYLPDIKEF